MGYMTGQFLIWISLYIVVVCGAPGSPPRNVRARSRSPQTVMIEWDEPEKSNGEIEGYKVFYTTQPELPIVLWQVETVSNSRMATITGLDRDKTYTISVLAFSRMGQGPLSQPVHVITRQGDYQTDNGTCDSDPLKVKPKWTKKKDETMSLAKPAGHDIEIDCDARGHPRPNITWYKNNKEIQISEDGKYTKDGWKIKIVDLTLQDQANYTCVVQNECGAIRWTYGLEVVQRMMVAPMIEDIANQTVMKGEDALFTCKILVSDSQPFLQWLRHYNVNGSYVDENGEPYVHKLQQTEQLTIDDPQYLWITNVTEEDAGRYTCLVANSIGMTYRSAWLTVLNDCGEVSEPQNGSAILPRNTFSRTTVTFTCDPGFELFGMTTITCLENGTWDGSNPTCRLKDCGPFEAPLNGSVVLSSGTVYASIATIKCDQGFTLYGKRTRQCLQNGTWEEDIPVCFLDSMLAPEENFEATEDQATEQGDKLKEGLLYAGICISLTTVIAVGIGISIYCIRKRRRNNATIQTSNVTSHVQPLSNGEVPGWGASLVNSSESYHSLFFEIDYEKARNDDVSSTSESSLHASSRRKNAMIRTSNVTSHVQPLSNGEVPGWGASLVNSSESYHSLQRSATANTNDGTIKNNSNRSVDLNLSSLLKTCDSYHSI